MHLPLAFSSNYLEARGVGFWPANRLLLVDVTDQKCAYLAAQVRNA